MKRKLAIFSVVVIALSLIAYGTSAFFSASGTAHNVLTMGNIKIELADNTIDGETEKDFNEVYPNGMPVMPGSEASKLVYVKNTGSAPAYVRIRVEKAVSPATAGTGLDTDYVTMDFNDESWIEGEDGYWYYKAVLEAGEESDKLFTTVFFDKDMGNDYMSSAFSIIVSAEAVQAQNNTPSSGDVLDVVGWPESPSTT